MIDKRFALDKFLVLEKGSHERVKFMKELEHEIADYIDSVTHKAVSEVANKLSKLGHNLSEKEHEFDDQFSTWSYEYCNPQSHDQPRFWLHTQAGVMSGYTDKSDSEK